MQTHGGSGALRRSDIAMLDLPTATSQNRRLAVPAVAPHGRQRLRSSFQSRSARHMGILNDGREAIGPADPQAPRPALSGGWQPELHESLPTKTNRACDMTSLAIEHAARKLLQHHGAPRATEGQRRTKRFQLFFAHCLLQCEKKSWETDSSRGPKTGLLPFDAWGYLGTLMCVCVCAHARVPRSERRAAGRPWSTRNCS